MKAKIHIIKERCKGCNICIEICQMGVLDVSEEKNTNGYRSPRVKNPDECINCGMCEMFCPDFAIWVTVSEEEKIIS